MKIGIMQPYFFPYIGYYQLIYAVDIFVFYDDVNFIKNGWINRNRILINNSSSYITVQLKNASPFLLINEIKFTDNRDKIKKSIEYTYKKALFFEETWPIISNCLDCPTDSISELAIQSIMSICNHLEIKTKFKISSIDYQKTKGMERSTRIMEICHLNRANTYINAINGQSLYLKEEFNKENIKLNFIQTEQIQYKQFSDNFVPWLSIIDVLMFNGKDKTKELLNNFELK